MTKTTATLHQRTFTIEWGDMDALGHVNNSRYFDYFQQSRIDWLESIALDMKQLQGPVVVHVACTYLNPIVYPASLTVKSNVHSLGRSSFVMDHDLFQDEQLMAQGISKIVWIDYQKKISIPIPDKIRQLFQEIESKSIKS